MPFDPPRDPEPANNDEPVYHPSGWSPVFVGSPIAGAVPIGYTSLQLPHGVMRFVLTSPLPPERDPEGHGGMLMHGDMTLHPWRDPALGRLVWAWQIDRSSDVQYLEDEFRPERPLPY